MMKKLVCLMIVVSCISAAMSETVSIYDIQYPPADANGLSPRHGDVVDCAGIVVYVTAFRKPKIILYDGVHHDGWGGIILKDWTFGLRGNSDIVPGNEILFHDVEVEDFEGTTFLQYGFNTTSSYTVLSTGNPLPEAIPVRVSEFHVDDPNVPDIQDHSAEKYEGMFVKVIDVNTDIDEDLGYGKGYDNYALTSNVDMNTCLAADFLNEGSLIGKYHELVQEGRDFCGVSGFVEQFTGFNDENIFYDYYQIITTTTDDFLLEQIGDLNDDCAVNLADVAVLTEHWLEGTYWN